MDLSPIMRHLRHFIKFPQNVLNILSEYPNSKSYIARPIHRI